MKLISKNVLDLTPVEYRACYLANYGYASNPDERGLMRFELSDIRAGRDGLTGKVLLWWDETIEPSNASLHAWALITPTRTWGNLEVTKYAKRKSKLTVQFWVKRQYRRQGIGKMLLQVVLIADPHVYCYPHSEESAELFSGHAVTTSKDNRTWLKNKPR